MPAIVFSIGAFSKYSVVDTFFPPNQPTQIIPGVFYKYYLVFYILSLVYSLGVLLVFYFRRANDNERRQVIFMGSGSFILFLATVFFGNILPVFFNELRFFNVGPQFSLILILSSSYAILRHRLFDITLLIKKSAVFAVLFAVIFFVFTVLVSLFATIAPGLVSNIFAALIITVIFSPLKTWLELSTDRIFFSHRRGFDEVISVFNESLTKVHRVDDLLESLPSFIRYALKIDDMAFLLLNDNHELVAQKRPHVGLHQLRLPDDSVILDVLNFRIENQLNPLDILEREDLAYRVNYEYYSDEEKTRLNEIHHELDVIGYNCLVPFISNGHVIGLLFLGQKLSGERFSQTDFRVLSAIAHEGSIALDSAINFERTARLNELKNEFVGVVSHQLRTPLAAAKWNADLLLGKKLKPDIADPLGDVQVNLLRLNDGLNSMLTVLAIEQNKVSIKHSRVNVMQAVVADVLKEFKIEIAKKHLRVISKSKPKSPFASLDPEKIKKVVSILLSNAVLYTPERSTISIAVEGTTTETTIAVEDQGFGVPVRNRQEIFERFFRGADAKKISPDGLGVNLYIARDFVTRHNGKLWVEDRQDGKSGARFVFTIPTK